MIFAALVANALAGRAAAQELVVGAVRDRDGYAVDGARVRLLGAAGVPAGSGVTSSDGTFAVEPGAQPLLIAISCRFCESVEIPYDPHVPVVVVRRYRRLPVGAPSGSDVNALPPRAPADLAALVPFAVERGRAVSDRGLRLGADTTAWDGIGLYRALDDAPLSTLLPGQGVARVDERDSAFELDSSGPEAPRLRLGTANAGGYALRSTGDPSFTVARAYAGGTSAAATGSVPLQSGSAGGALLVASNGDGNLAGASSFVRVPLEALDVSGAAYVLRSAYDGAPESDLDVDLHASSRARVALTAGVRASTISGATASVAGRRIDDAAYAFATTTAGASSVRVGISADPRVDLSLAMEIPVAPAVRLAASYRQYAQTAPLTFDERPPRARLVDVSAQTSRGHRFDARLTAYSEHTAAAGGLDLTGVGLALNYQVGSQITLRTWALRDTGVPALEPIPPQPYRVLPQYGITVPATNGLMWLTYENGLRFDVIYRGGAPDASVYVPLTREAGISAGTHASPTRRAFSIDLVAR